MELTPNLVKSRHLDKSPVCLKKKESLTKSAAVWKHQQTGLFKLIKYKLINFLGFLKLCFSCILLIEAENNSTKKAYINWGRIGSIGFLEAMKSNVGEYELSQHCVWRLHSIMGYLSDGINHSVTVMYNAVKQNLTVKNIPMLGK